MSLSFKGFPAWMRRAALPFGFALAVTAGSAAIMHKAVSTAEAPAAPAVAQILPPPPAATPQAKARGGHPAPTYVRAIDPDAVYTPPKVAKTVENHEVAESARKVSAATLPEGVERFDRCAEDCDSRDPLIERASLAASPTYEVVGTPAAQEGNPLFSLPNLANGVGLVDRAREAVVSAGAGAADGMKKALESASEFAAGLVR